MDFHWRIPSHLASGFELGVRKAWPPDSNSAVALSLTFLSQVEMAFQSQVETEEGVAAVTRSGNRLSGVSSVRRRTRAHAGDTAYYRSRQAIVRGIDFPLQDGDHSYWASLWIRCVRTH